MINENELELTVTVTNNKGVNVRTQDGNEEKDEVKLEPLGRETINMFVDWLNKGNKLTERREFELLGSYLYQAIFNGSVGTLFEECLNKAQEARKPLLVRLSFDETTADLADFPWEYLYHPHGFFLSTHVHLVLSRYISLGKKNELDPVQIPLRVLVVVSSPEGENLVPVGVYGDEVTRVIQELGSSSIRIDELKEPTIDNFLDALREKKPHVLHFIGYGRYRKDKKEAAIALLDDNKAVRWVSEKEFADYFVHMNWIPHLVLLHLCASATIINGDTFTANFAHLAPQLLQNRIPAVVAMQYPLTKEAATVFTKFFYRALAKGDSIDSAVQEARSRIATKIPDAYNDRLFGTPVLYMRSYGGIIQRMVEPAAEGKSLPPQDISPDPIPTAPAPSAKRNIASEAEHRLDTVGEQKRIEKPGESPAQENRPVPKDSATHIIETISTAGKKAIQKSSSRDEKLQELYNLQLDDMCNEFGWQRICGNHELLT